MNAFHNRKSGIIHAASAFYIDGRDKPPTMYPLCGVKILTDERGNVERSDYATEHLKLVSLPAERINCGKCRAMDEFKDTLRHEQGSFLRYSKKRSMI